MRSARPTFGQLPAADARNRGLQALGADLGEALREGQELVNAQLLAAGVVLLEHRQQQRIHFLHVPAELVAGGVQDSGLATSGLGYSRARQTARGKRQGNADLIY